VAVLTQGWGSPDNAQLVTAHLSGDPRAFQELVARYHGRLINFVNRMIRDRERAEDLVQEVFIRVHRHLSRFDPTRQFSTWIYTIASNLAKNELRRTPCTPTAICARWWRPSSPRSRPITGRCS